MRVYKDVQTILYFEWINNWRSYSTQEMKKEME